MQGRNVETSVKSKNSLTFLKIHVFVCLQRIRCISNQWSFQEVNGVGQEIFRHITLCKTGNFVFYTLLFVRIKQDLMFKAAIFFKPHQCSVIVILQIAHGLKAQRKKLGTLCGTWARKGLMYSIFLVRQSLINDYLRNTALMKANTYQKVSLGSLHVHVYTEMRGSYQCTWWGLKGLPEWWGMEEEEHEDERNGSRNMAEHLPTKEGCQLIKQLCSSLLPHKSSFLLLWVLQRQVSLCSKMYMESLTHL